MTAATRTPRFRAALVGCGRIGSEFADDPLMDGDVFSHAEAYHVCEDTSLAALVDTDPARLNRCGDRWGVSARFSSVSEMMAAVSPEIVSVATPTASHADMLETILASDPLPRAILCEKPIASTVAEGERVVKHAQERGVLLVVMHMRRYATNMQNLRRFLREGRIGELRGVTGWLTKGTVHNGTHWFDLLRFLVGEVELVHALDMLREGGDDPTLEVALRLENGMLATMRAAEVAHFTICEMDIMGSRGRARIVDSSYRVEISKAEPSPRYSGYVELVDCVADMGDRRDVMLHAVEDIVHCLRTGAVPQSSGEDGLAALRIGLAAHESVRTGGVVRLRNARVAT